MEKKEKKYADFQDDYKRSSNFNKVVKPDDLNIAGNGKVKLDEDKKAKAEEDKKKISDAFEKIDSEEE
ncbi:hypothetical protein [Aequorivita echinoideorum]|uniref:Uncharacterized protein n=1 Tax=Aequorivita echinoideorum TaxID=1549647 RepID=A0ABS5S633_9FLAO|nr:hypothetical protein [Aequorivita echinoideorum]MBT0608674.1 hypothetical protein [Aequorivita echinoideorum]